MTFLAINVLDRKKDSATQEWTGHSSGIDEPLQQILNGTYNLQAVKSHKSVRVMRKAAFNSVLAGFRSEDPEEHKRAETLALTMSAQKIADARTLYSLAWYIANEEIAAKNQFKIRNIDLAVRMARDASELAPTDSTPLTILAYAYNQQKIHEKAVATQK